MREERAEDDRPPHRARDGTEEDERHAARAALRREHLGGGGAGELDDRTRSTEDAQPGSDEHGGLHRAAGGNDAAAHRTGREAAANHGHAPDAVHQPAGGADGDRSRHEEDRGPEPKDPGDAGDGDERQRAQRCGELEHPGVADEPSREQERVALDGRCDRDAHSTSIRFRPEAKAARRGPQTRPYPGPCVTKTRGSGEEVIGRDSKN